MSVSVTTRPPRPGEVEGRDYYFVDEREFLRMRDGGELLEWARVFGNLYATPKKPVMDALASGRDVMFDIDWQGTQQLRESASADLVRVFVLPPSPKALEERLIGRAQDAPDVVKARMAQASNEIGHWAEYDYVVVNANIDKSVEGLRAILAAERLKRDRLIGLPEFVRALQDGL